MRARGFSLLRLLAGLALTVLLTLAAAPVRAQDDGPRVYQLAPVGAQNVKGLQPVFRLQKIIAVIQNAGQNRAVHFGIVNNQDFLFLRNHGEEVTST